MTLDELYGAGSQVAFEAALVAPAGATYAYANIRGGVRIYANWAGGGRIKLDCYPNHVFWQTLNAGVQTREGLSQRAHDAAVAFFRPRGVTRYLRSNDAPPAAEVVFRSHGTWVVTPEGQRMDF